MVWEQHGRNEPLDARAYALSGVYLLFGERLKALQQEAGDEETVHYGWADFWKEWEMALAGK